jgi:hypothetical protein
MTQRVELADGTILEFPDGTSLDVIQKAAKRIIAGGAPPAAPSSPYNAAPYDAWSAEQAAAQASTPGPPIAGVGPGGTDLDWHQPGYADKTAQRRPAPTGTLTQHAEKTYGFDPNLKRGAILPLGRNRAGETEFATPQIVKDAMTSALAPGFALKGGQVSPLDATKFALDFSGARSVVPRKGLMTKRQFIEGAPTEEALKKQSQELYKRFDESGQTMPVKDIESLVTKTGNMIAEEARSKTLDPQAHGVMREWLSRLGKMGDEVPLKELEVMRREGGRIARNQDEGQARIGYMIQEMVDDFSDKLPKEARRLWRLKHKVEDINEILFKADNSASGFENGLRTGFRQILNNKNRRKNFTKAEIEAFQKVVNGGPLRNVVRTLRHLGPGVDTENRFLGFMLGMGGGFALAPDRILEILAIPTLGHLAGRAARRGTTDAAKMARAVAARGGGPPPIQTRSSRALSNLAGPTLGSQLPQDGRPVSMVESLVSPNRQATTYPRGPNGGYMVNGKEYF